VVLQPERFQVRRQPTSCASRTISPTLAAAGAAHTTTYKTPRDPMLALINRERSPLQGAADLAARAAEPRSLATYGVTQAFLPLQTGSWGAIVNNLSLNAFAPLPVLPG
jgi:hypothetical protein